MSDKKSWHSQIICMLWIIIAFEVYKVWPDRWYVSAGLAIISLIDAIIKEFKEWGVTQ